MKRKMQNVINSVKKALTKINKELSTPEGLMVCYAIGWWIGGLYVICKCRNKIHENK